MNSLSKLLLSGAITFAVISLGSAPPGRAQSPGNFSTLSTTGTATLGGDVLMCSGRPWIDVRCMGAAGNDTQDDTAAIQTTINNAIANNWPVHIPAGTYKVTSAIVIDYAGQASHGFRLISQGAVLDGRAVSSGPVMQIQCSGGTPSSPTGCFYFKEEGSLFINASTPGYAVIVGKTDFSDAHNSIKIDHVIVNNASTSAAAGACQFNYVLDSDIYAVCDSSGGGAGLAFEQTQFSRISGAGTAAGTGGRSIVLENGFNFSNTFSALDLEVSPTCLSITFNHNGLNTFVSPYFDCTTAVNATASIGNILINPNYGGAVVNYGPNSVGISVQGSGSRTKWIFPASAAYSAAPIDDGLAISSFNAPGASMTVSLPSIASVNSGWAMAVASDNGKGMILNGNGAPLLTGNKSVSSITLGPGNYEYVRVESDGNNWRVVSMTRNTSLFGGFQPPPWPANWLYPVTSGYSATLADNGNILSSFNASPALTVTLPPTGTIPNGWSMGFATDGNKALTINVTDGHIVWPGSGASATSLALANTSQGAYEFLVLQYDSTGAGSNFRVIDATPATWQAIGAIGSAGISRWSFPMGSSAYSASRADNGNVISAYNSTASTLTVTLPSTTAIAMGWTIGLTNDNGKIANVQVNSVSGGHILFPGGNATSASLASGNYEFLALRFDGGNFRVTEATPATAAVLGIAGADFSLNRFNFPATSTYAAQTSDGGNVVSSYNSATGLSVTLPATSTIYAGWTMGFMTDNNKSLTVNVNGGAGERLLLPVQGGISTNNMTLGPGNYEFLQLKFDGSNYRVVSATPQTINGYGGLVPQATLPDNGPCNAGAIYFDNSYVYICTATNTVKRAALSPF